MIVHIPVTQDDIAHGIRKDCHGCPIARAILRVLKPGHRIEIAGKTIRIERLRIYQGQEEGIIACISLVTNEIAAFVNAFDKGQSVKPFTFKLNLPERLIVGLPDAVSS